MEAMNTVFFNGKPSMIKLEPSNDPRVAKYYKIQSDRCPYFKQNSLSKKAEVKYLMNIVIDGQRMMVKRDQVEPKDYYQNKYYNETLDKNQPDDDEYDKLKPEDVFYDWPMGNFVYVQPNKILKNKSRFPAFFHKDNEEILGHFLQNQAWQWRFKFPISNGNTKRYVPELATLKVLREKRLKNMLGNIEKTDEYLEFKNAKKKIMK